MATVTAAAKKERAKAERQFAIRLSQLKEMAEQPELVKELVKAHENDPEEHISILFGVAKAMVKQQKLEL